MNNQNVWKKLGDCILGKGFYIVLFLCVATIGISGYYLMKNWTPEEPISQPAGGDASVVLPDVENELPAPAVSAPQEKPSDQSTAPAKSQPDDPEPVKEPVQAVEPVETEPAAPVATVFTWPVKGEILRDFSVETLSPDPTLGDWRTHGGLDIAAAAGTKVLAMGAGTVSEVFEDGLMGTTVVVDHGNGLFTTYANLEDQTTVAPGDTVETGTVIGTVGSSAIAEVGLDSHLHLEASLNGEAVDPRDYLPKLA